MERSDTTALSSYVLVNDTLLVNESSPTEENGALYQSSAGNTKKHRQVLFFIPAEQVRKGPKSGASGRFAALRGSA